MQVHYTQSRRRLAQTVGPPLDECTLTGGRAAGRAGVWEEEVKQEEEMAEEMEEEVTVKLSRTAESRACFS
jgi:hypothetical protein